MDKVEKLDRAKSLVGTMNEKQKEELLFDIFAFLCEDDYEGETLETESEAVMLQRLGALLAEYWHIWI